MLNEEGLILVAILAACTLVALGALELVWPTRPRHPARRPAAIPDPLRRPTSRTVAPPRATVAGPRPAATTEVAASIEPLAPPVPLDVPSFLDVGPRESALTPAVAAAAEPPIIEAPTTAPALRIVASGTVPAETVWPDRPRPARARPILRPVRPLVAAAEPSPSQTPPVEPSPAQPPASAEPELEESLVARGFVLVKAGQFSEAVLLAQEALEASKSAETLVPTTRAAQERARLWGVVGLGRAGLDDVEGARFAFEEAIALAPGTERLIWERHLVELALAIGRRSLAGVDAESHPEHLATLRSAMEWLERGLDVAPDDPDLRATLTAARDALWPAHETIVKALVQRQEFGEARRVLADAMADPECPPERQGAFRRLLGRTMGGEVAQAAVEAGTHLQSGRADDAMAALVRAQGLLEAVPADALSPRRRQELERRLWEGYVALGIHQVDAGTPDAALDPLFRAVAFTEVASERREEARGLLVRALGEIVEARSTEIVRLVAAGDTTVAAIQGEKLWSLLRSTVDQGLPEDLLEEAFAKVRTLLERIGAKRP